MFSENCPICNSVLIFKHKYALICMNNNLHEYELMFIVYSQYNVLLSMEYWSLGNQSSVATCFDDKENISILNNSKLNVYIDPRKNIKNIAILEYK